MAGAGAVGGDGGGDAAEDIVEQLVLVLAHRRRLLRHHERLHRPLERADPHQLQVDPQAVHAAFVEGDVGGDAGDRQLAGGVNQDRVAGGGQVVLAGGGERQVAEGSLAVRAQERHQLAQLLDAGVAEVDPFDLEQHAGDGRIDRQRAQPADHLEEVAIVVDPLEAHPRHVRRRHQRRAPRAVEVDAPRDPGAAGAGAAG